MDKPHRRLEVWREAMVLVRCVYDVTADFPRDELFGLTSQMRRAAVSVASNIAEGAARGTSAEYAHFLSIARGSLSELDTQMEIAVMLKYLPADGALADPLDRVGRLLTGLYKSIQTKR